MNKVIMVIFLVLSLSFELQARVFGGVSDGGGQSVVCRDGSGKISSAELLDLYEARVQFGYELDVFPDTFENSIDFIDKKVKKLFPKTPGLDFYLSNKFRKDLILNMNEKLHFLPKGTKLKIIDDANEAIIPVGCKIEQLANYNGPNRVLIDTEIWDKLDHVNKLALLTHEIVFYFYKKFNGEKDSRNARKIVGYIFSDLKSKKIFPDENVFIGGYKCSSSDGHHKLLITRLCNKSCITKVFFFNINNKQLYTQLISKVYFELFDYIDGKPGVPKLTPYGMLFGSKLKSKFLFNDTYDALYRVQPKSEGIESGDSKVRLTIQVLPYNKTGSDAEDDPFNKNMICYKVLNKSQITY